MTLLRVCHALIYLGDGALLMPCAALLFAWLITVPVTRRIGWWWLVVVLLVGGGVALSKVLYMVTGWRPAGWDFIGLSGHAALSFLFWPSMASLVISRDRAGLRVVVVTMGACLALAVSVSSWILRDHSLVEIILGALWGVLAAAVFLAITRRHEAETPLARSWMIVSMLLLVVLAFGRGFPSARVLGQIALWVSGQTTIHTRTEPGPGIDSSKAVAVGRRLYSLAVRAHTPPRRNH